LGDAARFPTVAVLFITKSTPLNRVTALPCSNRVTLFVIVSSPV